MTTTKETVLAESNHMEGHYEPIAEMSSEGCFGTTALLGRRRQNDTMAYTACETLLLSKDDLETLLSSDEVAARQITTLLVGDQVRSDRLEALTMKLLIGFMDVHNKQSEGWLRREAIVIQLAWQRYKDMVARKRDPIYKIVMQHRTAFEDAVKKPRIKRMLSPQLRAAMYSA